MSFKGVALRPGTVNTPGSLRSRSGLTPEERRVRRLGRGIPPTRPGFATPSLDVPADEAVLKDALWTVSIVEGRRESDGRSAERSCQR
jgi:hypothetical protein